MRALNVYSLRRLLLPLGREKQIWAHQEIPTKNRVYTKKKSEKTYLNFLIFFTDTYSKKRHLELEKFDLLRTAAEL